LVKSQSFFPRGQHFCPQFIHPEQRIRLIVTIRQHCKESWHSRCDIAKQRPERRLRDALRLLAAVALLIGAVPTASAETYWSYGDYGPRARPLRHAPMAGARNMVAAVTNSATARATATPASARPLARALKLRLAGNDGNAARRRPRGTVQPFAIIRCRSGLSTNKARPTTMKFITAVTTNTMCQLPVADFTRFAIGTRNAEVPFAV